MARHRHHHRRHDRDVVRSARMMLVGIFVLLRIPDAFLYYYSIHAPYPVPAVRGHAIINVLWTTIFMVAFWTRRIWARYLLIVYMGYVALISCLVVSMGFLVDEIQMAPAISIVGEFVADFAGTMILIFSRDLDRLGNRT